MTAPRIKHLGRVDYLPTAEAMRVFTETRAATDADEIWICEHPSVYTQGIAGRAAHVLDARGIPVVQTNRGGQVTYHGPGQVVAYTLVDLRRLGIYVKEYVYRLEHCIIKTLEIHSNEIARDAYERPCGNRAKRRRPVCRARQDRGTGNQSQPPLHLSRGGAERFDGPVTVRRHRSVRLRRAQDSRLGYTSGFH